MCSIWSKLDGCEFDESHRQLMRHYVVHTHTHSYALHTREEWGHRTRLGEKNTSFSEILQCLEMKTRFKTSVFCRLSSRSSFNRCSRFTASNSVHPCVCFFILFILALLLFLFARNCINYCHTYRKSRNSTLHLEQKMHHMFHVCFKCGVCVFSFRFFSFEPNECSFFFCYYAYFSLSLSPPLAFRIQTHSILDDFIVNRLSDVNSMLLFLSLFLCVFFSFISVSCYRSLQWITPTRV